MKIIGIDGFISMRICWKFLKSFKNLKSYKDLTKVWIKSSKHCKWALNCLKLENCWGFRLFWRVSHVSKLIQIPKLVEMSDRPLGLIETIWIFLFWSIENLTFIRSWSRFGRYFNILCIFSHLIEWVFMLWNLLVQSPPE